MADARDAVKAVLLAADEKPVAPLPQPGDRARLIEFYQESWCQAHRHKPSNANTWSRRAPHYASAIAEDDYTLRFIEKLALEPGDSALDMGCGNGLIALPLAHAGHSVLACDFSEGMLAALEEGKAAAGLCKVETKLMSWEDDWLACGVRENCADVAFASRSVITQDLRAALEKLTRSARKRACATLGTGYSPKISEGILRQLGVKSFPFPDYQLAFNVLVEDGFFPEVSFIASDRRMLFDSREDACLRIERMLDKASVNLREDEVAAARGNIADWVEGRLESNPASRRGEGAQPPLRIVIPNDIIWAFVSWSVSGGGCSDALTAPAP